MQSSHRELVLCAILYHPARVDLESPCSKRVACWGMGQIARPGTKNQEGSNGTAEHAAG